MCFYHLRADWIMTKPAILKSVDRVEMECSNLFIIASLRGVQAGAILAIDGLAITSDADSYNRHRDLVTKAIEAEARIAIRAVEILNGK